MRRLVIATLLVALARSAPAQEVLLPSSSWGFAPIVSAWHFAKSLSQSTGAVKDVAEVAVPFQFRVTPFGGSWTLDLTGAYAAGAIHVVSADSGNQSGGKSDDVFIVNGPTDLKVRLTGPLAEGLILSLGANVPIGLSRLDSKRAAPSMRMSTPSVAEISRMVAAGSSLTA